MKLGRQIKQAWIHKGINQNKVADALHVSRKTISHWETGKSYPDIYRLIDLSNYYDISIDNLIKEDNDAKKSLDVKVVINRIKPIMFTMFIVDILFLILSSIKQTGIQMNTHILLLAIYTIEIINAVGLVFIVNFQNELSQRIEDVKEAKIKYRIKLIGIITVCSVIITFLSYFLFNPIFYFLFLFSTILFCTLIWVVIFHTIYKNKSKRTYKD